MHNLMFHPKGYTIPPSIKNSRDGAQINMYINAQASSLDNLLEKFSYCIYDSMQLYNIGVKVRNMKMDLNTGGTQHWVGTVLM